MAAKLAVLLPEGAGCSCKAARTGAGGGTYKAIALATAGWLGNAPMRNASTRLFNDGLYCSAHTAPNNVSCTNDLGTVWSYCQVTL